VVGVGIVPALAADNTDEREIMKKLKLNLGSGDCPIDGYVNIDRKNGQEAYPLAYEDDSVDEIRASHILEHFGFNEIDKVLRNWVDKLKPGGLLKIAVPDIDKVIEGYRKGDAKTAQYICGGQIDENDYHKSVFNRKALTNKLEGMDLHDVSHWDSEISDSARLPISLNLQAFKSNGSPELSKELKGFIAKKKNVYSQNGEDGIIEAIFERIGINNKWCLEVGASDGILFSNTRQFVEKGWNAILIESEKLAYDRLVENCKDYPNAIPVFAEIGINCTLDSILKKYGAPKDLDLMVIDIDGQDYHVVNAMLEYEPRILVVEYAPLAETEFIPPLGGKGQAGRAAITRLGCSKGYRSQIDTKVNLIMMHYTLFQETEYMKVSKTEAKKTKTISKKITAIMSCPRLGFTNNLVIAAKVFAPMGIDFEVGYGVFWSQVLSRMIEEQIARGMDWIVILDYDSYYLKEHFLALCQLMAEYPEVDAILPVQIKRENDSVLAGVDDPNKANYEYETNTDLIEIDTGHFGLTIFRASAFAKLKKPWFIAVPNEKGEWAEGRLDDDIYFWKNWRKCGLKVCLTPQVLIGHMQLMVTWPGPILDKNSKPTHQYINTCSEKGIPEWCKVSKENIPKHIRQ